MSKVSNWFTKGHNRDVPFRDQPLRFRFYVHMLEYARRARFYDIELVGAGIILLVLGLGLCSCVTEVIKEDTEPEDLVGLAEQYCEQNPLWPCGHVYTCADGQELCQLDDYPLSDVEAVHGACAPTSRHVGLCWWCCGGTCGPGCNALNGCFCPAAPMPEPIPEPKCDPHPLPPTKD